MEDNQTMVREDSEIDDAKEIIDKASERLRLFNQLVQKPIENLEFADYLLKDINHIYVLKSFQGLGDDINENWEKYENVYETIQGLPDNRIWKIDNGYDSTTISKSYKEVVAWLEDIQGKIDKKIHEIDPDIYRPGGDIRPHDL